MGRYRLPVYFEFLPGSVVLRKQPGLGPVPHAKSTSPLSARCGKNQVLTESATTEAGYNENFGGVRWPSFISQL